VEIPSGTVIIAGPTGVGKTVLALRLAAELGGEIVGADAFQPYAGLPILTAQPTALERAGIPHHLIGSVDPLESFDAGRYQRTAKPILHEIAARDRIPIIVGGTGLYLKALLEGLDELPKDPDLRRELSMQSLPVLIARLEAADPEAPAQIELANRRRVERALEIVLLTGKPLAQVRIREKKELPPGIRPLLLMRDREELNARIAANVMAMFARGVEAEVAALPEERVGQTAAMTLGLREIRALLRGEISREEAILAITTATRRYAKRQMTWFRNQHDFPVLNLTQLPDPNEALAEALRLLKGK
jgi:tRNA dimethylallyltransferase